MVMRRSLSRVRRRLPPALLVCSVAFACNGTPAGEGPVLATFPASLDPDLPIGGEIYACQLFDARQLQGAAVHELRWTPPAGALSLHHAMMFVTSATGAPGPWPCEPMPPAVAVLPLYAPGGETTTLADGVSIVIPASAQSLFVEMHLYRREAGSSSRVDSVPGERSAARAPGRLGG